MDNQLQIPEFTRDEFRTTKPYEYVYSIRDRFQRATVLNAMLEYAKAQKITGVKAMWEDYLKSLKQPDADYIVNNVASFSGAPLELNAGTWTVSESGIERDTPYGAEVACVHPIIPIERYVNVDTGVEKLKIWWRKGKTTRTQIFDKRTLATASSIVALADHGVAVNSESAKALVRWLHDAENLNYELIPEKQSVGRLGWIEGSDDEPWRFSPYAGTLEFDGDENFRSFFGAVSRKGKLSEWLIMCKGVLSYSNVTARILLAASFASVLVKPLGTLPFFVHLWGGTESGKTVSLMLAASVWANPEMGRYIHTFNSTSVGKEMSAAFVNSLPLIMDELQVARSKNGQDEEVYKLAEGVGRTRSNQKLGVSKSSTWSNCILTTGESPLTSNSSGGGAVNRIINIECKDKVFDNARIIANFSRQHYGHAGKIFVERLMQDGFDRANELYGKISRELAKSDITEKQAMAAAIILVGDILATEYLFKDDKALTIDEIQEFLATKATVDVNGRGYQYMCEWVAQNAHKLTKDSIDGKEVWGELKDGIAYIVRSRFSEAAENEGYNSTSLLSYLKQNHLIRCPEKGTSITCRINGIVTKCVGLVLPGVEQLFLDP
jgi:hypothetical protein